MTTARRGVPIFYTDTNGLMPEEFGTAFAILGTLTDTTPLDEIGFEGFDVTAKDIDAYGWELPAEE